MSSRGWRNALLFAAILIVLILLLAGCATTPAPEPVIRTLEVRVPVEIRRQPPPELLNCFARPAPFKFGPPTNPADVACLTAEQAKAYVDLMERAIRCSLAWEAWAGSPP